MVASAMISDRQAFAATLAVAEAALAAVDPVMREAIERLGPCRLAPFWERSPYEALVRAVCHQQLHATAAEAILGRLIAQGAPEPFPSPAAVLALDDAALRRAGFSRSKADAIRAIAREALSGAVPSRLEAESLADDALIERLTPIRGIGRWTVEMLLIFTFGRLDVFPLDDFGVRSGLRTACSLAELPSKRQMTVLAEPWRPYRSVASWYLWRIAEAARQQARKARTLPPLAGAASPR